MNNAIIDPAYILDTIQFILPYLKITMGLALGSTLLGTIIGLFCSLVQIGKIPVLKPLSEIYVLICRSLPNMVLLYLVYYGMPLIFMAAAQEGWFDVHVEKITALQVAVIGLSLHVGAYLTEIFRAAYLSVPEGQIEASQAMGMTWMQAIRRVILPQAVVFALPMFANQFLSTLKSTSIVFVITVMEIFGAAKLFSEEGMRYFEAYLAVASLYWLIGILFEYIFAKLEYALSRFRRGNAV